MNKPLRIALVMQGGREWIGGMEYIRNIILALASLPKEVRDTFEVSLLATTATEQGFIESVRPHLKDVYMLDSVPHSMIDRLMDVFSRRVLRREVYQYDAILRKGNFDFVYPYVNGINPDKAAAWIYDFQHKYLPDFFSKEEIKLRDEEFSDTALHRSLVVLSSKSAAADFKKFYPEAVAKTKVLSFKTIPQPQWYDGNPSAVQQTYHLPDKFFIVSNQFWQHKGHLTIFQALKLLNKRGVKPMVVCTGHIYDYRKPGYSDIILQTIHKLGLAQQVFLLGLIPKSDQMQLLRRAIVLIQPSLFEGWSTVVEDARCLGKHLILSDLPVHLEQNPPHSRFFERESADSLSAIMADYWQALSPGPDLEMESMARAANKAEVVEFAKNFLAIAKSLGDRDI